MFKLLDNYLIVMKTNIIFHRQDWDLDQWKQMGFSDKDRAGYWKESCCGILCLKMILDTKDDKYRSHPIASVIENGVKINAYTHRDGWSHDGLTELARKYGLEAKRIPKASLKNLTEYLDQGYFPVISIKWAFENNKTWKERIFFWKK